MIKIKANHSKCLLLIAFILFVAIGYVNSDAYYYRKIIKDNNIQNPEDAFRFIDKTIKKISCEDIGKPFAIIYKQPMRDLHEENKWFWCDQGAILLSNLLKYTPSKYHYRFVDIIGLDNISHHTVIEVFEENKWRLYDVVPLHNYHKAHFDGDIKDCVHYKILQLKYRNWSLIQKIYHFLTENNTFIKFVTLKIRGIY